MATLTLSLILIFTLISTTIAEFPPTCNKKECPSYNLIHQGNGFEIRHYNSTVWISTNAIHDISFYNASTAGFLQLFHYISGKNNEEKKIQLTLPVLTEVLPSDGPFCESSFIVSLFVPKANQPDPPTAKGFNVQKWVPTYVAVRQFDGFAYDYVIGREAAALKASLAGTKWYDIVEGNRRSAKSTYVVAQYNILPSLRIELTRFGLPFMTLSLKCE